VSNNPSCHITNLIVFELQNKDKRKSCEGYCIVVHTLDILKDAKSSSLMEMEKLFVCCPICTHSPIAGAKISFVIARILAQLSINASAAFDDAWTIILGHV
jgi:hypothetical protein